MAFEANDTWQSQEITKDEVWQVTSGAGRVFCLDDDNPGSDLSTSAGNEAGVELGLYDSIRFSGGQTVYYRRGRSKATSVCRFERIEVSA